MVEKFAKTETLAIWPGIGQKPMSDEKITDAGFQSSKIRREQLLVVVALRK